MSDVTNDDIVVSFKPHPGYDAPLVVFKAESSAGMADKLRAAEAEGLFEIIGNIDEQVKAGWRLGNKLSAEPVVHPSSVAANATQAAPQGAAQAAATAPPGQTAPTCQHGTKVYKTGQGRNGREWKAWMCPAPKADATQCAPEWIR